MIKIDTPSCFLGTLLLDTPKLEFLETICGHSQNSPKIAENFWPISVPLAGGCGHFSSPSEQLDLAPEGWEKKAPGWWGFIVGGRISQ